jgi:hypothetical protein
MLIYQRVLVGDVILLKNTSHLGLSLKKRLKIKNFRTRQPDWYCTVASWKVVWMMLQLSHKAYPWGPSLVGLLASRPGWLRTSHFATNQPSLINDINIFFKAEVPKIPIPISLIFDKTPLKPLTCSVKSPQIPQSTHKSHQFKIISTYIYIYIYNYLLYIYTYIYISPYFCMPNSYNLI